MGLSPYRAYVALLAQLTERKWIGYHRQLVDSLFAKNSPDGALRQPLGGPRRRRVALGAGLLETLTLAAVVDIEGGGARTRPLRVDELIERFEGRYDLLISRPPAELVDDPGAHVASAENVDRFKARLREIGLFTGPLRCISCADGPPAPHPGLSDAAGGLAVAGRDHLVGTLAAAVSELIGRRGEGHCLLVPNLPLWLADAACRELVAENGAGNTNACTVVESAREPWHATPTKAVELRNMVEESGGKLVLFVPSGTQLAAEDSFGRSTFEVFDVRDLEHRTVRELEQALHERDPQVGEEADRILTALADKSFEVDDGQRVAYLARLLDRPRRDEVGKALTEVGLLPDASIAAHEDDQLTARLHRNLQQMRTLTEVAPPEERVRSLPLDRDRPETAGIVAALLNATRDGDADRFSIAARLADGNDAHAADFAEWHLDVTAIRFDEFRVMQLVGDFSKDVDRTVIKANAAVGVRLVCRPAPSNLTGLKELLLELMRVGDDLDDLAETGVQAARRRANLPGRRDVRWTLRVPTQDPELGQGVYCFRVRAFNEDNLEIASAASEPFRIGDVEPPRRRVSQVPSLSAAVAAAAIESGELPQVDAATFEVAATTRPDDALDPRLSVAVRFAEHPEFWELGVSRLLARLENYTLEDPDSRGIYAVAIESDVVTSRTDASAPVLPQRFLEARARTFDQIRAGQRAVDGAEDPRPLVALADLIAARDAVDDYLAAWTDALAAAETDPERRALLDVDQVSITEGGVELARLVAPTHPLRLGWLLRYQRRIAERLREGVGSAEGAQLYNLLETLRPANVPHIVIGEREPLRHSEPLDLGWGLWTPADGHAASLVATRVRPWLFGEGSATATVSSEQLVTRIRRYLVAHPFVDQILLNFVQPGSARVVLDALLALQRDARFAHLHYVVRLFATDLSRSELGSALDEFMADPEAARTARRDEADAFLAASDDPLFPKLTYSKHPVADLTLEPESYPAHLTFLLDWFDLKIVPAAPARDRRSLFGDGLVVDPVVTYRPGSDRLNPQWDASVLGVDGDDPFTRGCRECGERTAQVLAAGEAGLVPALRLDLDRVRRSVLDAVHRSSDWVVVVDPVFSDDLLDAPSVEEQRYLIDYVGDDQVGSVRRVVVSTRSRRELLGLLGPITATYGLDVGGDRVDALLDALQVLGAGLPLKLLNNRTHAFEALSLSLASLYLAEQGVFRRALAIPLDLHQQLFREYAHLAGEADSGLRRTDIAIVRVLEEVAEPHLRFAVRLIEVKARQALPEETPPELVRDVDEQLENSRAVLRSSLFGADLSPAQRALEGTVQVHRLARILSHYAERAYRYGYLDMEELARVRWAVTRLGHDLFRLSFKKQALLFDLDGGSQVPERVGDVLVTRVGRGDIDDLLARAGTPLRTQPFEGTETLVGWDRDLPLAEPEVRQGDPLADGAAKTETEIVDLGETAANTAPMPVAQGGETVDTPAVAVDLDDVGSEGPTLDEVLLLGAATTSPQFGIIGRLKGAGTPVALDLDGTNTICVFGAPGYGKSYTVGAILEAALMREPALNRLPRPLAAVVFHYQDDQSYAPEFASMGEPNDDVHEVDILRRDYGAAPDALQDVRVLVPDALLAERRAEYPHLSVHPLRLASQEIGLNDWQLLMGLTGGDQMYARAMNRLFATIRDNVTIDRLRDAIAASSLTQTQKALATTRVEFAAAYVGDASPISEHLLPGRLIVVDLRDQLIAQDEALAIFMVLLRTFGQVERGEAFNKLFVFDEAHKYMRDPQLRTAIDTAVRERRHRGTTVVIASQDPPSVPPEIIGLSNILVAHTFTVPGWLEYVRRVKVAFAESGLKPSQLAALGQVRRSCGQKAVPSSSANRSESKSDLV